MTVESVDQEKRGRVRPSRPPAWRQALAMGEGRLNMVMASVRRARGSLEEDCALHVREALEALKEVRPELLKVLRGLSALRAAKVALLRKKAARLKAAVDRQARSDGCNSLEIDVLLAKIGVLKAQASQLEGLER